MPEQEAVRELIKEDRELKEAIFNLSSDLRSNLRNIFSKEEQHQVGHLQKILKKLKCSNDFKRFLRLKHEYKDLLRLEELLDETKINHEGLHSWWNETYKLLNRLETDLGMDIEELKKELPVHLQTTYFNILTLEEDEASMRTILNYIDNVYLLLHRYIKADIPLPINAFITSNKDRLSAILKKFQKGKADNLTTVNFKSNSIFVLVDNKEKDYAGIIFHLVGHLMTDIKLKKGYGSRLFGHESICYFFQMFGKEMITSRPNHSRIKTDQIKDVLWEELGECCDTDPLKYRKLSLTTLSIYTLVLYKYGDEAFIKFLEHFFTYPDSSIFEAINCIEPNQQKFILAWKRFYRIN